MDNITCCVILSAGNGSRLKPLTEYTPKPLIKVQGKPVISYVIDNLHKSNITNIAINVYYKPEKLLVFASKHKLKVYPEKSLKGTAGALLPMKSWLSSIFVVTNADTISNVDFRDMIDWHRINDSMATIFTKDDAVHSGGTYIFSKTVLDYIPKNKPYSIHEDLIPDLIQKFPDKITLYSQPDLYYYDIGTLAGLKKAQEAVL